MPNVSVIITAKNRPAMLREAILSVLAQTYRNFEIVVVLTGATAAVDEVAASFLHRRQAIKIIRTEALNLARTRNVGLAEASGAWVSFLDDDDVWMPAKLATQLDTAYRERADLVTTNWVRFGDGIADEAWRPRGSSPLPAGMTYQQALTVNNFVSVGSLVRTDVLRSLGGFDGRLRACEDWDMWRRVSHRHQIAFVDEYLMRVRVHGRNMSKNKTLMFWAMMRHFAKMARDTPPELRHLLKPLPRAAGAAVYHYMYAVALNIFGPRLRTGLRLIGLRRPG